MDLSDSTADNESLKMLGTCCPLLEYELVLLDPHQDHQCKLCKFLFKLHGFDRFTLYSFQHRTAVVVQEHCHWCPSFGESNYLKKIAVVNCRQLNTVEIESE